MAPVIATIKDAILGGEPPSIYECRECGTSVEADTETCPACSSDAIARYEIG